MKQHTVNILLSIGIPASVKGFTYICDAMELFDTDPYYTNGKICALYHEIAVHRNTSASCVERAIRHAFEIALKKGRPDLLEQYLDLTNTQNSNLLHTLYLRCRQFADNSMLISKSDCHSLEYNEIKQEIYREIMNRMSEELTHLLQHFPGPQM